MKLVKEFAKKHKVTERCVRQWIADGSVKAKKIGRDWHVLSTKAPTPSNMGRPRGK